MSSKQPRPAREFLGVISVLEVYTLAELKLRLGWTDSSLRSARRAGRKLLGHGKRRFVAGRDVLRFLQGESSSGPRLP